MSAQGMASGGIRPNILLVTTDQQGAHAMGLGAHRFLRTPAMDRLASEGTLYEKAYVANPICVPSRTSYMTGTLPHENGVTFNTSEFPFDTACFPCLAGVLRDQGYRTGHFGKWHVPHPLQDREWSGFDEVAAEADNEIDHEVVPRTLEFLAAQDNSQPFFAVASFVNPHDICEYARVISEIPDRLKNGEIGSPPPLDELPPLPPNWNPPAEEPFAIRTHYHSPENLRTYPSRTWGGPDDVRWRQYLWAYYRMVELVDRRIDALLQGIDRLGKAHNTLVLFTSDHGDGAARHHWTQKTMFYDECSRVPLIARWPGHIPKARRDASRLINLGIDLFPSIFAAAGIPGPTTLRGRSFLFPESCPGREFVVCENNPQTGYGHQGLIHGRMLRTARFKYVRYSSGVPNEQFFDMEADPLETHNLIGSQENLLEIKRHRHLLESWFRETDDTFPL